MYARISLLLLGLALLGPLGDAEAQAPRRPLPLNACAGDQSNVPYWTSALKAQDPRLRVRAARNLGEARTEAAVPALVEALKDESPEVRLAAIQALGRIGPRAKAAIPALTQAMTATDPDIRAEAARALEKLNRPR